MKLSFFFFLVGAVTSEALEASQDPPEYVMEDPLTIVDIVPPEVPILESSGEDWKIVESGGEWNTTNATAQNSTISSLETNYTAPEFEMNYPVIVNELEQAKLTCKDVTCSVETSKCVATAMGATCTADVCLSKKCHPQKEMCVVDAQGMPVCIADVCYEAKCTNDQDCVVDSTGAAVCEDKVCQEDTCEVDEMCQPKIEQCPNPPCPAIPECTNLCSAVSCPANEECRVRNGIAQCYPDTYKEPTWWKSIKRGLMADQRLKRCWRRDNVAPENGSKCSETEKMCFFGDQPCKQMLKTVDTSMGTVDMDTVDMETLDATEVNTTTDMMVDIITTVNTTMWPTTRCHCDGKGGTQTWMCVDVPCPVVKEMKEVATK